VLTSVRLLRQAANWGYLPVGEVIRSDMPGTFALALRKPLGAVARISPWNGAHVLAWRTVVNPATASVPHRCCCVREATTSVPPWCCSGSPGGHLRLFRPGKLPHQEGTDAADGPRPGPARAAGQKEVGAQGAGSHHIAVDRAISAPGRTSVTTPASARLPSLVPPR
jgi:hypothetical protein